MANGEAVVYAPATAHDQRSGLSLVPIFHQAGYHVLLFSYWGHGLSDGLPGRFTYGAAESKDVDAAVAFLHKAKHTGHIAVIGHSAGAAILSAARNPDIGAVIAVAPFNCPEEVRSVRPGWTDWHQRSSSFSMPPGIARSRQGALRFFDLVRTLLNPLAVRGKVAIEQQPPQNDLSPLGAWWR